MREPWIKQPAWLGEVVARENARGVRHCRELSRAAPRPESLRSDAARPGLDRRGVDGVGAVAHEDGAEVFETMTPAALAIAAEAASDPSSPSSDAAGIFSDAMAYFFAESPHPAHVMRRVFDLAFEIDTGLLRELPGGMIATVRSGAEKAHAERVRWALEGTRCAARSVYAHEKLVDSTLRLAVARRRGAVDQLRGMELAELLQPVDGLRLRGLRGLIGFAFYAGARPGVVTRRIYCLAKWRPVTSGLLHDMTLHQLGLLFGEVRATWSWRVKQVVNRFLALHRMNGGRSGYQRSERACETYAQIQRGNQNRLGGAVRRSA